MNDNTAPAASTAPTAPAVETRPLVVAARSWARAAAAAWTENQTARSGFHASRANAAVSGARHAIEDGDTDKAAAFVRAARLHALAAENPTDDAIHAEAEAHHAAANAR